jgi:hypothetical protein
MSTAHIAEFNSRDVTAWFETPRMSDNVHDRFG